MWNCLLIAFILMAIAAKGQDQDAVEEQRMEQMAVSEEPEQEDDEAIQQLVRYARHPLNLNSADETELETLGQLSPLQVKNFFGYRKLLGNLLSIYELQAVPGFSIDIIRKILPYITISNTATFSHSIKERLRDGEQSLLMRWAWVAEPSKGFSSADSITAPSVKFYGSRSRLLIRYNYQYKQTLQYGILGDKDAGEQFFRGAGKAGFDFYSFHFFIRKWRWIKALALGDYTINFGQGLIHWQNFAFKKSADIMNVKRQGEALKPYRSAGEYNFHRGIAATFGNDHWALTLFTSSRRLSANLSAAPGSAGGVVVSSIQTSGLHRTENEISDRAALQVFTQGARFKIEKPGWHLALNGVHSVFSIPIQKKDEPYNLYAIKGKQWMNESMDYSYTFRNIHVFGELAVDRNLNKAIVNGFLASIHRSVDIAFIHRSIGRGYQSFYGNAFTESTMPANEKGLYFGISLKPLSSLTIGLYADIFEFPWLRYQVDAPSQGSQYLFQCTWKPDKKVEVYSRLRYQSKQINKPSPAGATAQLETIPGYNCRINISVQASRSIQLKNRMEFCQILQSDQDPGQNGFLMFTDISWKPVNLPFSGSFRFQYFETDGYDTRLYAYENDVLYSSSIPAYFDKGLRYYINGKSSFNLKKPGKMLIQAGIRVARTLYDNKLAIGSGQEQIMGNKKSDIRVQLVLNWP